MSQRSTWLWAIRTDMSADARSVLAAVDDFCALLWLALLPLFPSFSFLLCCSVFAVAWWLCVRGCSIEISWFAIAKMVVVVVVVVSIFACPPSPKPPPAKPKKPKQSPGNLSLNLSVLRLLSSTLVALHLSKHKCNANIMSVQKSLPKWLCKS